MRSPPNFFNGGNVHSGSGGAAPRYSNVGAFDHSVHMDHLRERILRQHQELHSSTQERFLEDMMRAQIEHDAHTTPQRPAFRRIPDLSPPSGGVQQSPDRRRARSKEESDAYQGAKRQQRERTDAYFVPTSLSGPHPGNDYSRDDEEGDEGGEGQ